MEVVLSSAERAALEAAVAGGDRRPAERARIVLSCAGGTSNAAVAREFSTI